MKIQEVFVLTGEVIVRDMTPEELEQREKDNQAAEAELAAKEARKIARAEVLSKLGLNEEESKLLLS